MVGCVIVKGGRIIGEGYHQKYGAPHAEVNAIASTAGIPLHDATLYVTLEPCSHFGKTPPCADLIVAHGLKRVVVANQDPNPLVAGKGLAKLKNKGIAIKNGILSEEAKWVNRRFFRYMQQERPYIILKWAQTADAFIARENFDSKWISNPLSRKIVHAWRSQEDAIMVGKNTALHDDPLLTTRDWSGKDPIRLVIDHQNVLPQHLKLFNSPTPTWVFNELTSQKAGNTEWIATGKDGFYQSVFKKLRERRVQSVLVEGGAATLNKLIGLGLWDEARVFTSPKCFFQKGIAAPKVHHAHLAQQTTVDGNRLQLFVNPATL